MRRGIVQQAFSVIHAIDTCSTEVTDQRHGNYSLSHEKAYSKETCAEKMYAKRSFSVSGLDQTVPR